MLLSDIPKDWKHTREGVWHRPYLVKRGNHKILEWKIYYEGICKRCKNPLVDPRKRVNYCTQTCANRAICKFGKDHRRWKGGKAFIGAGYVLILVSRNPRKYVFEHRLVMEKQIGRKLFDNEVVHHINGIRADNRPENLIVMTRQTHIIEHRPGDGNIKF